MQSQYGHLSGVATAADLILSRLGNFPGRQLLRKKRANKDKAPPLFPHYLLLEASAREIENTVDDAAGTPTQLTDFQYDLLEALTTEKAVSVSAPTSAGKSFILSLSIIRRLKRKPAASIVYLVPTRALIRQVLLRITRDLNRAELGRVPVRSVPLPLTKEEAPHGVVYVLTQERLLSLLHSDAGVPWITTMIVDEAQKHRR